MLGQQCEWISSPLVCPAVFCCHNLSWSLAEVFSYYTLPSVCILNSLSYGWKLIIPLCSITSPPECLTDVSHSLLCCCLCYNALVNEPNFSESPQVFMRFMTAYFFFIAVAFLPGGHFVAIHQVWISLSYLSRQNINQSGRGRSFVLQPIMSMGCIWRLVLTPPPETERTLTWYNPSLAHKSCVRNPLNPRKVIFWDLHSTTLLLGKPEWWREWSLEQGVPINYPKVPLLLFTEPSRTNSLNPCIV